ncbi:alkaline shock response membrane anchor protein AmaP [Georgenia wutianyii]|uniref:Alkaline shock response membrane anchor protein AmaP n=1 Tax=Georgenia wutianyii TaxID=2585135 RepID=A0ABX5VJS1_9MICO|nr:alkaline shock response membrane anchor protein AmaP [Georgenia wutianyii]QDB78375.1 alkaline shock response membrane anchor protein AmaP [Georgenia wutianyii]
MSTRVDGANRAVLTLLGLALLAAGVLGLVLSLGGFGTDLAASPVLPDQLSRLAADTSWFWPVVAAACLVIALLGLRWLLAQLRTDRVTRLDLTQDPRDGLTTLHAGALIDAVEDEAGALRGVTGASAHLRGEDHPRLDLTVDLSDRADVAEIRAQLEELVIPHLRQAADAPDLAVDIVLRPGKGRSTRRDLT